MTKEFVSPFTGAYWRCAAREFRSPRMLVFAALMLALRIVLGMLIVPVGDNLRMLFKFIPDCIGAMIYGPFMGMCVGGLGDILGYVIFPTGAFFPGYTVSAILTNLVFALFLYRREISFANSVFTYSFIYAFQSHCVFRGDDYSAGVSVYPVAKRGCERIFFLRIKFSFIYKIRRHRVD